jgi:protein-disulfide isomerase
MHARLFENQDKLAPEALIGHAEVLGLDKATFEHCLDSGQFREVVRKSVAEGQAAGVNGTPSLFLGKVDPNTQTMTTVRSIVGAQPIAAFRTAIDEQLLAKK